ncbi:MAG: V-type ATPase 116kDa subunit family protein [Acholeplasmataceae bacterium]
MGIAKIKLVDITSNTANLDPVLSRFVDLKDFHPVLASEILERVHGSTSFVAENPCQPLLQELDEIEKKYDLNLPATEQRDYNYDFNEMYDYMAQIKESLSTEVNNIKELEAHIRKYKDALIQVKNIESLDIALNDLFACEFISIRFGRLPKDSVEKLRFFQSRPFVFKSFTQDANNSWCMYYTTDEYKREVDNIFSSLFFERIFIPDFVHGRPKEAISALEEEIKQGQKMIDAYKSDIYDITCGCSTRLSCIKAELLFLNRTFEAKKYVVGLGDKFTISGFVEEHNVEKIKVAFEDMNDDIKLEVQEADADKRITPPTKLKNGWFSKPFGMFVEMYGLPGYKDIDPTPFVAITYSLLFGIMFGDLGQGLVLMLLGWLLYKYKNMRLGAVGVRIGLSSAIFGLIYGSVFGNEELLNPMFHALGFDHKPIHVMDPGFTMTLLIAAIGIGAFLIVIAMILNIVTLLKKKKYAEVIASHNGFAGLMLYGFILVGVVLQMGLQIPVFNGLTIGIFVGLPLFLIFLKEPIERKFHGHKMFPTGFGGFFVEGFFELFEIVLSYVTNTMSFLRVGGFVLSHAGMMLVVTSLMTMVGGTGSIIVLVFGNIFVMALEGMIVGIQVLRLEFYEMFSRYYEGNGVAFNALNL